MSVPQRSPARSQDAKLFVFPASPAPSDWLSRWHLLSLDAPTVATLWTVFVTRAIHASPGWALPVAMFLSVWMLYAADRLLDARDLDTKHSPHELRDLEARHLFHHRHRRKFVSMLFVASVLLMALLPRLQPMDMRLYAALAALLAAYFFLIHIYFRLPARLPKEFAVGVFFAAAVYIPAAGHVSVLDLLPSAISFAALCTLNCLYVYAWEHPGARDLAHSSTRFAASHLTTITGALLCLEGALFCFDLPLRAIAPAMFLSTLLLGALHNARSRLSCIHLRAAADLALLTPLLFLPWLR